MLFLSKIKKIFPSRFCFSDMVPTHMPPPAPAGLEKALRRGLGGQDRPGKLWAEGIILPESRIPRHIGSSHAMDRVYRPLNIHGFQRAEFCSAYYRSDCFRAHSFFRMAYCTVFSYWGVPSGSFTKEMNSRNPPSRLIPGFSHRCWLERL